MDYNEFVVHGRDVCTMWYCPSAGFGINGVESSSRSALLSVAYSPFGHVTICRPIVNTKSGSFISEHSSYDLASILSKPEHTIILILS
jgi:hypothetical protein